VVGLLHLQIMGEIYGMKIELIMKNVIMIGMFCVVNIKND